MPRSWVESVVKKVGPGAEASLSEGMRNRPRLPAGVAEGMGVAEYGIQYVPPPPPELEEQATVTLVTLEDATLPEPPVTVQSSPVGCTLTVTA
jgi:hypothetical protein